MAKGVEDTAFYRYARFIALNEVGGDPAHFGIPVADFHALQELRQRRHPDGMTSLSTHDTKRGEDVRARLAVLTELADEWSGFAELFLSATSIPSRAFGYFVAQTLVGTGPIERTRMHAYAEKAMREASDGTTWTDPDPEFETAVHSGVDTAYDDPRLRAAWDAFGRRDHAARLVGLPEPKAGPVDDAGNTRRLSGHGAVGGLARRPGQPPGGRLRPAPADARRAGRTAARRRHRCGQALGHLARPAPTPRTAGVVHRLPAAARPVGPRPESGRLRAKRRFDPRHPPAGDPDPYGRLARHAPSTSAARSSTNSPTVR